MADTKLAARPRGLRQAGFFTNFIRIAEKNLTRDGEHQIVREGAEQRREEVALHAHVGVEENDDLVLCSAEARIRSAAKALIPREPKHAYGRKCFLDEIGAAVGRAIIDYDDLVVCVALHCLNHRWQIL